MACRSLVTIIVACGVGVHVLEASQDVPSCPDVTDWLYDKMEFVPRGYHVVCISGNGKIRQIELWSGGHREKEKQVGEWDTSANSAFSNLRKQIKDMARIKAPEVRKASLLWGLFDSFGGRVRRVSQAHGVLLIFTGGRWVWPGIREGYKRQLQLGSPKRNATLRTFSLQPLVFMVDGVFDNTAAEHVIRKGKPLLIHKPELHPDNSARAPGARTNRQVFIDADDEILEGFQDLAASIYRLPKRLQENIEVLEYTKGQKYDAHLDYFDRRGFAQQPEMMKVLKHGNQRLVTGLFYLSDLKGGETFFPGLKVMETQDFNVCAGKIAKPKLGRLVFWYNIMADSSLDEHAWHGGCKVRKGAKYVVNIVSWNIHEPHVGPHAGDQADEPEAVEYNGEAHAEL